MKDVCPTCGCNRPYHDSVEDLMRRGLARHREFERVAARLGVCEANAKLAEIEAREHRAGLQSKVARQARVIHTLEKKLKKRGQAPYAPEEEEKK